MECKRNEDTIISSYCVLVIALAAMAMPVMADGSTLNGEIDSYGTISIGSNTTLTFPSHMSNATAGLIEDKQFSTEGQFLSIHLTTNDPNWYIKINGPRMTSVASPTHHMKYPIQLKASTTHTTWAVDTTSYTDLPSSATTLFSNTTAPAVTTDIPLSLRQVADSNDIAHTDYASLITLAYTTTA